MSFGDMVSNDFQKLPKLSLGKMGDKEAAATGAASERRCFLFNACTCVYILFYHFEGFFGSGSGSAKP
jgi:hypothetical protein